MLIIWSGGLWRFSLSLRLDLVHRLSGGINSPVTMLNGARDMRNVTTYLADESGASAAEYALILAIIAVAIVTALGLLQTAISGAINNAANNINS